MKIFVDCPNCKKTLKYDLDQHPKGSIVKCPYCKSDVTIEVDGFSDIKKSIGKIRKSIKKIR